MIVFPLYLFGHVKLNVQYGIGKYLGNILVDIYLTKNFNFKCPPFSKISSMFLNCIASGSAVALLL